MARDWYLRREPSGIVVIRSDVFPDRLNGRNTTHQKFNCKTKKYLVHQRYLNEELHWTEIDSVWTWKDVLLPDDPTTSSGSAVGLNRRLEPIPAHPPDPLFKQGIGGWSSD